MGLITRNKAEKNKQKLEPTNVQEMWKGNRAPKETRVDVRRQSTGA